MLNYIVIIEFSSKKYDEQGVLTYKVKAYTENEAREKVNNHIALEIEIDRFYNYTINLIMDIEKLPEIR